MVRNLGYHCRGPWGFLDGSVGKESACNAEDAGDTGLIPGPGESPGGGNGNPLQYSCLKHPKDRGSWRGTVQIGSLIGELGLHMLCRAAKKNFF